MALGLKTKGFTYLFLLVINYGFAQISAQTVVDKTIAVAGGDRYEAYEMAFDFRDKHYISTRKNGVFEYTRLEHREKGQITMSYGNIKPFQMTVNGDLKTLDEKKKSAYQNSINSVNYFVLLPFGLNDAAVYKNYKGKRKIKGENYHEIEITFSENGGGKDFEDVYYYWIHTESFKVDYMAYSFLVNGGGIRFREAFNERYVNGIRFVDYRNFKPESKSVDLFELPELFENEQLSLVSTIELKNVKVN